ncbi:putative C-type lectin domain family 20 member A [Hemibagrus wyckioides]|uniref:putative C-type lectin domain family 20 member A n=1 Tax=Hemibagrus wyckioides TaxID=337641 RepID=UPI00266D354A|nr:putative C-type lectin domain family 20 member A [Hemibagrus wyckioides]XP_058240116.1 putative C-type lectin domain family 20 member A [Hemibagrus wyckioides]XP_058240117.1 putative C-type lectin domain family 20 member A [Hemibagrus wyckioides]XP_058240118.1 putative C-type lectin domain family 20 member A [Hemibagrus wyckioides]
MKLNLFLLLLLTGLVPVVILQTALYKYYLMMTKLNWSDAQNYCRVNYNDLAKFQSDSDWQSLITEATSKGLSGPAWVGIYNDINSWRWSLNELPLKNVPYTCWASGEPDNIGGKEACGIIATYNAWSDVPCTGLRPFICYNANFIGAARFIAITTRLSWSQAQAYCRTHHTDLASALNSSDKNMLWQITNIQGDSWIGLYRDTWKWSDGTIATYIPWALGQPDNSGGHESCVILYNGQLHDAPCTNLYNYFCHFFITWSRIVRLQVKSDGSVFDPAVQSSIVEQIKQNLKEKGMLENTTVTWRVQPDGNIFHKITDGL